MCLVTCFSEGKWQDISVAVNNVQVTLQDSSSLQTHNFIPSNDGGASCTGQYCRVQSGQQPITSKQELNRLLLVQQVTSCLHHIIVNWSPQQEGQAWSGMRSTLGHWQCHSFHCGVLCNPLNSLLDIVLQWICCYQSSVTWVFDMFCRKCLYVMSKLCNIVSDTFQGFNCEMWELEQLKTYKWH